MKHLLIILSAFTMGVGILTSTIAMAEDAVSITGDGTTDVVNMKSTSLEASASSITGDANIIGYYFTQKNSNVRSGSGTTHNIIVTLKKGTEVHVMGKVGEWYHIGFGVGSEGYIYSSLLAKTPPKK